LSSISHVFLPASFHISFTIPNPIPRAGSLSIARRSWSKLEETGVGFNLGYRRSSVEKFSLTQIYPLVAFSDPSVTELFDIHFCGHRDFIFIYYLHLSTPIAMHTFVVVLVLHLEQHAIFFLHINLHIVHTKTARIFLDWYKSFDMICFAEMRSIIGWTISL
jgi:hypothetical protein